MAQLRDEKVQTFKAKIRQQSPKLSSDVTNFFIKIEKILQDVYERLDKQVKRPSELYKIENHIVDLLTNLLEGNASYKDIVISEEFENMNWPEVSKKLSTMDIVNGIIYMLLSLCAAMITLIFCFSFAASLLVPSIVTVICLLAVAVSALVTYKLFDTGFTFFQTPKVKLECAFGKVAKKIEQNIHAHDNEVKDIELENPLLIN